jgi:hypothetical protein
MGAPSLLYGCAKKSLKKSLVTPPKKRILSEIFIWTGYGYNFIYEGVTPKSCQAPLCKKFRETY